MLDSLLPLSARRVFQVEHRASNDNLSVLQILPPENVIEPPHRTWAPVPGNRKEYLRIRYMSGTEAISGLKGGLAYFSSTILMDLVYPGITRLDLFRSTDSLISRALIGNIYLLISGMTCFQDI